MNTSNWFIKRCEKGGYVWNTYAAFLCIRFSHSIVNDLMWYAGLPRQIVSAWLLSLLLWVVWLSRPWIAEEFEIR